MWKCTIMAGMSCHILGERNHSVHGIMQTAVNSLWWRDVPQELRVCHFCHSEPEDECHAMLYCVGSQALTQRRVLFFSDAQCKLLFWVSLLQTHWVTWWVKNRLLGSSQSMPSMSSMSLTWLSCTFILHCYTQLPSLSRAFMFCSFLMCCSSFALCPVSEVCHICCKWDSQGQSSASWVMVSSGCQLGDLLVAPLLRF